MGASSGLIIAFVVAVWAAYFVPLVLRRYDDASKNVTVDDAGSTGRVIAPGAPAPSVQAPSTASPAPQSYDRPAARLAAARRRRTLLTLLGLFVLVAGLAVASVVPWLGIVVPAVLIAAWLIACRVQVRGELGLSRPRESSAEAPAPKTADDEETVVISGQYEDINPGRQHVMENSALTIDALDDQIVIAVPSVSAGGDALWDPLPVTLPTYVTKPRAGRTVRTIDFAKPGAWTSGHIEAETEPAPQREETTGPGEERRAVGS